MSRKEVQRYPWQYKLAGIMAERKITQRELCSRIGMTEAVMSLKIGGCRKITVTEAIAIARVIGLPVEEIFVVEGDAK